MKELNNKRNILNLKFKEKSKELIKYNKNNIENIHKYIKSYKELDLINFNVEEYFLKQCNKIINYCDNLIISLLDNLFYSTIKLNIKLLEETLLIKYSFINLIKKGKINESNNVTNITNINNDYCFINLNNNFIKFNNLIINFPINSLLFINNFKVNINNYNNYILKNKINFLINKLKNIENLNIKDLQYLNSPFYYKKYNYNILIKEHFNSNKLTNYLYSIKNNKNYFINLVLNICPNFNIKFNRILNFYP